MLCFSFAQHPTLFLNDGKKSHINHKKSSKTLPAVGECLKEFTYNLWILGNTTYTSQSTQDGFWDYQRFFLGAKPDHRGSFHSADGVCHHICASSNPPRQRGDTHVPFQRQEKANQTHVKRLKKTEKEAERRSDSRSHISTVTTLQKTALIKVLRCHAIRTLIIFVQLS